MTVYDMPYCLKYDFSPSVLSRWQKNLNGSNPGRKGLRKQDRQLIECLKTEIDRLNSVIVSQSAALLYLVESLIVEKIIHEDGAAPVKDMRRR